MCERRILVLLAIVLVMGLLMGLVMGLVMGSLGVPSSMSAPAERMSVAISQEPNSIDPSLAYQGGDYTLTKNIAEFLIRKTSNGDLTPGLATSWKVSPTGSRSNSRCARAFSSTAAMPSRQRMSSSASCGESQKLNRQDPFEISRPPGSHG